MNCLKQIKLLLLSILLTTFCGSRLSWAAAVEDSVKYVDTYANDLECIEEFQERQANISSNLTDSVTLCQTTANKVKLSYDKEKQQEKEDLIAASVKLCACLDACNELEMDEDFFNCHAEAGHTNMLLITSIHLNSSKTLVDLEDRYTEAEKQRLHCYLEAEHEYLSESITAQQELTVCLNTAKIGRKKGLRSN